MVNISTSQNVARAATTPMPQLPNDPQLDELFRDFFNRRGQQGENQNRGGHAGAAPRQFARLRLHHRRGRHRGHQQPRDRRRRRDHRHPQRRHAHQGRADRQGHQGRPRAAADQERQAAEGGEVRRFRQAAAGRMGGRDRQPVQPRRHGDRRHRLGAQPRHQFRSLRQLHPDRRRHQSRQFGRPAVQSRRRGDRHQHRDHLAVRRLDRHRLCGAVEDRASR